MDVPLTLGTPHRGLLDGLFDPADATFVAATFVAPAEAAELVAAGRRPGLSMRAPVEAVADFLAVLAHSSVGFVTHADSADDVLAILCATVAALCGDDVRAALRSPDVETVKSLHPDAATAVREVLVAVQVDDPDRVRADLRVRGLTGW